MLNKIFFGVCILSLLFCIGFVYADITPKVGTCAYGSSCDYCKTPAACASAGCCTWSGDLGPCITASGGYDPNNYCNGNIYCNGQQIIDDADC